MIWYIVAEIAEKYGEPSFYRHKMILEKYAKDCCLVLHYKSVNRRLFAEHRPWAICHSGCGTSFSEYDVLRNKAYGDCITRWDVAQIGFCGGHQIIANYYKAKLGPIRRIRPDEPELSSYSPGQFKEWGVYPVNIIKRDPLFRNLPSTIRVQEYHAWEVKNLGRHLTLLASSKDCHVQAFVHKDRPVYGVQFHPEQSPEKYQDGFSVLRNFFQIAKKFSSRKHPCQFL